MVRAPLPRLTADQLEQHVAKKATKPKSDLRMRAMANLGSQHQQLHIKAKHAAWKNTTAKLR